MEEKVEMVKKMMELEKEKRSAQKKANGGDSLWRSASTQKQIKGYSDMILTQHRINQPVLPPTSLILGKENNARTTQGSINQIVKQENESSNTAKNFMIQSNQYNSQSTQFASTTTNSAMIQPTQQKTQNKLTNNLSKALRNQNEQFQEVDEFLTSVALDKYKDTFLDNGIEDLETILELDDKHLEQMNIPLGHKLKIMKKIKDVRKEKGMSVPESRQGERQKNNAQQQQSPTKSQSSQIKQQANNAWKLNEPNKMSGGVGTENEEKETKKSGGIGNSLLDGEYNEEEARNEFLQALNAWRNAGKEQTEQQEQQQPKDDKKLEKKVRFSDTNEVEEQKIEKAQKKSNFLWSVGDDSNWNVVSLPEMPQFEEKEIISTQDNNLSAVKNVIKYTTKQMKYNANTKNVGINL